jgi:hypothetical protein
VSDAFAAITTPCVRAVSAAAVSASERFSARSKALSMPVSGLETSFLCSRLPASTTHGPTASFLLLSESQAVRPCLCTAWRAAACFCVVPTPRAHVGKHWVPVASVQWMLRNVGAATVVLDLMRLLSHPSTSGTTACSELLRLGHAFVQAFVSLNPKNQGLVVQHLPFIETHLVRLWAPAVVGRRCIYAVQPLHRTRAANKTAWV